MYSVLVVDDEAWMCEGMTKIIQKTNTGFDVVRTAENGLEGLASLHDNEVDVVLADICMPGMDGLEMLRRMREAGHEQPVVIISGHHEFDYAQKAIRYGVYDYLLKPVDREEISHLLVKLSRKLEREHASERSNRLPAEEEPKEDDLRSGCQIVRMMMDQAKRKYMNDLSISVISDQTGFNPSYLSRIFKQETGKGYVQYVTEIRLEAARKLLMENPDLHVSEIAHRVGYWDDKHFSKQFKREFGMTPSEYRRG
ncbi:response regulator [Paenibacillus filicis]|uniref:Response regulator n=1 Tax=Paenibacillus gyeongsangnamensis TaxID=3388067 RepID=A0ABT4QEP4_9BACL|nr:response regulator [Paenibacillus filicis]MCZ8515352.1 response regulator [Paenibacillus filicis]